MWDLVKSGVELFTGASGAVASVAGDALGYMSNTFGGGGGGILGLGAQIFGGADDNPWGMLNSPVLGHVAAAVGTELMKPTAEDRIKEQMKLLEAQEEARRKRIRRNYGLDPDAPAPQRSY